jgi:hypothetical protein
MFGSPTSQNKGGCSGSCAPKRISTRGNTAGKVVKAIDIHGPLFSH